MIIILFFIFLLIVSIYKIERMIFIYNLKRMKFKDSFNQHEYKRNNITKTLNKTKL